MDRKLLGINSRGKKILVKLFKANMLKLYLGDGGGEKPEIRVMVIRV